MRRHGTEVAAFGGTISDPQARSLPRQETDASILAAASADGGGIFSTSFLACMEKDHRRLRQCRLSGDGPPCQSRDLLLLWEYVPPMCPLPTCTDDELPGALDPGAEMSRLRERQQNAAPITLVAVLIVDVRLQARSSMAHAPQEGASGYCRRPKPRPCPSDLLAHHVPRERNSSI